MDFSIEINWTLTEFCEHVVEEFYYRGLPEISNFYLKRRSDVLGSRG